MKTKKQKLWQNSGTQIVSNLKNYDCDKTQKLKLWELKIQQNSKTQNMTSQKLKCDKTQNGTKLEILNWD